MLVLSRKVGESIQIGDDIVVTVLKTTRGKVKVAVYAPRDVPIHRKEYLEEQGQKDGEPTP